MRRRYAVLGSFLTLGALYQCGGLIDDSSTTASRPDNFGGSNSSTEVHAIEAGLDAGQELNPTGCSSRKIDESHGVLVDAASGSDGAGCGDHLQPCQTIKRGLLRASELGRQTVYVGAGYYWEAIQLIAGIRIEGAWDAKAWQPICGADASSAVTLQAPPASDFTVLADDLGGAAEVASLTVRSADLPAATSAQAGLSLYAIFARGTSTHLTLQDVRVLSQDAGRGADGVLGSSGLSGSTSGCADAADGANGQLAGTDGSAAEPGWFDRDGYVPTNGTSGTDGQPGRSGIPPSVLPNCLTGCGKCDGTTSNSCITMDDSCGTAGKAGCAGGLGHGGGAGYGGGSSVALYVWGASVQVVGGLLHAGAGGAAGSGGPAGSGGVGASGLSGKPGTYCYRCSATNDGAGADNSIFTCSVVYLGQGQAGGSGGKGGNGTAGGRGGNGRGGSSCSVVQGDSVQVTISDTTRFEYGPAGDSPDVNSEGRAEAICS